MLVFRAGINKTLNRISNREDPDQTASSEAAWSGSAMFVYAFLAGLVVFEILEHLSYLNRYCFPGFAQALKVLEFRGAFLKSPWKIKSALKSTGKALKSLEKCLNLYYFL